MSTILVGPKVLRTKAGQLRAHAASISHALKNVDHEIRSLNIAIFEGLRAVNLRRRYEEQCRHLAATPEMLIGFAQSLEQAADIFEQADRGSIFPGQPNLLQPLQQVSRNARQGVDSLIERYASPLAGLPRWSDLVNNAWRALVTPVTGAVRSFFTSPPGPTTPPHPAPTPPQPAATPAEPAHSSEPAHPDYARPMENIIITQVYKGSGHKGIDLSASTKVGTPIYSSYVGTVVFANEVNAGTIKPIYDSNDNLINPQLKDPGVNYGYGNTMIVEYRYADQPPAVQAEWVSSGIPEGQSVYALYAHLNSIDKNTGEAVVPGVEIAQMGNDGLSTGPHLHFEVRYGPPNSEKLLGNGWSSVPHINPAHIFNLAN